MTTNTFLPSVTGNYSTPANNLSLVKRFLNWCASKEDERLLVQGISLTINGCMLTPISMMAALLAGVNPFLYIPVIIAIVINIVSNLAAMPTKVTIPIFCLSILIDLGVITSAFIIGMDFSRLF